MAKKILQVNFKYAGPWGEGLVQGQADFAKQIAQLSRPALEGVAG